MHVVHGDLDLAEADIAQAVHRSDELGYPQNAYNRAFTYFAQIWMCLESGQLAEAASSIADLRRHSGSESVLRFSLPGHIFRAAAGL